MTGGFGLGVPELMVVLMIFVTSVVPLALGIWVVVTLHRIRISQDLVRATLESIEKLLQRT